jgi:peptide-methionine (S)-S-oxide reductase
MSGMVFDPKDVAAEREVVSSEWRSDYEDPSELVDEQLWATAYKEHPYHWSVLGWWNDVDRLLPTVNDKQKQFAFVLAALHGNAAALRRMIAAGVDLNAPAALYSHGTPLHHAVSSGSLEAVKVMVEAGANVNAIDTAWSGTPLGWAQHYLSEGGGDQPGKQYTEIADYLR